VLTLNGSQWTELLSAGGKPAELAAAGLGGSAGVGDAARWSQAFGREGTFHTLTGGHGNPLPRWLPAADDGSASR
jgi:hypothetical protein